MNWHRTIPKLAFAAGTFAIGFGAISVVRAEVPPQAKAEIEYLLNYAETSGCDFYRNGTWYDAKRGRAHLKSKYDWLAARNMIDGADDFIARAGSKSSISGRQYQVRCEGGAPQPSGPWLTDALTRLRDEKRRSPEEPSRTPPAR